MASISELEARVAALESLCNKLYVMVNNCASKETQRQANATWQITLDDIQESIGDHETRLQVVENSIRGI